jgi:DNA-binding response OmpR family regulator
MTTILLVEDAYDLAKVVMSELETQGYHVLHMCDGESALQALLTEQPALVILDWMLPKLDGLEVLRRIRLTSSMPVLMLTARGQETDRVVGLELGADDYLTKPFSMRELIARVRALLRRAQVIQQILQTDQNRTGLPLTYDRLHLNPESHQVILDGVSLDLSPIEFALLHLFLRSPGRAFSRAYLLDTVWGETYVGGDRSVDNTILRLRKKLGKTGEAIETVWGIGYKLRPEERH